MYPDVRLESRSDEDLLTLAASVVAELGSRVRDVGLGSRLPSRAVGLVRLIDRAQAVAARDLAVLQVHGMHPLPNSTAAVWVSRETSTSRAWAQGLLSLGRRLMDTDARPLPRLGAALDAGVVSTDQARAVMRATAVLPVEVLARAEEVLVAAGTPVLRPDPLADPGDPDPPMVPDPGLAPEQLNRAGARLRHALAPSGAAEKAAYDRGSCHLLIADGLDGLVSIEGLLSPAAGEMLKSLIEPLAAPRKDKSGNGGGVTDPRTRPQRQHDAFEGVLSRAVRVKKNHTGNRRPTGEPVRIDPGTPTGSRLPGTGLRSYAVIMDLLRPRSPTPPQRAQEVLDHRTGVPGRPRGQRQSTRRVRNPTPARRRPGVL